MSVSIETLQDTIQQLSIDLAESQKKIDHLYIIAGILIDDFQKRELGDAYEQPTQAH
jgi:hypothetical protein